jgi:DNA topoisomerase-1
LQKIWSKRQYFYGCSKYPDCKYTSSIEAFNFKKEEYNPDFDWEKKCPKCEQEMQLRFGKFGPFLGCVNYPECKGIVNIPKAGEMSQEEMPHCPAIGCTGKITVRRSRFGKIFFSCSEFPQCDVIVNHLEELDEKYKSHKKTACPPRKATKKRSAKPKQTKRSPIKGKKRVKN